MTNVKSVLSKYIIDDKKDEWNLELLMSDYYLIVNGFFVVSDENKKKIADVMKVQKYYDLFAKCSKSKCKKEDEVFQQLTTNLKKETEKHVPTMKSTQKEWSAYFKKLATTLQDIKKKQKGTNEYKEYRKCIADKCFKTVEEYMTMQRDNTKNLLETMILQRAHAIKMEKKLKNKDFWNNFDMEKFNKCVSEHFTKFKKDLKYRMKLKTIPQEVKDKYEKVLEKVQKGELGKLDVEEGKVFYENKCGSDIFTKKMIKDLEKQVTKYEKILEIRGVTGKATTQKGKEEFVEVFLFGQK